MLRKCVAMGVCVVAGVAAGDVAEIAASKDNTLYESATGSLSNGVGSNFFAGTTASGAIRRGLIEFDVAGAIPAGATINSATLVLSMSRTTSGDEAVSLYAVMQEWGEGTSNANGQEGGGAPAGDGDATWLHAEYDVGGSSVLWANQGGDLAGSASATVSVGDVGSYSWSGSGVTADVQGWLDDAASNHGWALIGNEEVFTTSKRFDSREHPTAAVRPRLMVDFTPAAECRADMNGDELLDFFDVQMFLQAFSSMDAAADFTGDGMYDFFDVQQFLQEFSAGCG